MQLRGALTTLLFALCCVENVAGRAAIHRRQDEPASPSPAPTSDAATSSEETPASTTASDTEQMTTQNDEQQSSTQAPTTSIITSSKSTPTHSNDHNATAADKEDELPIQPTITPAMGIAGVVLMVTGVLFCIGGIRHQWIVVFFSAAYLTALSVAVLIIYVMTPPVSDAIQGAYMIASLLTGLIFGAISLVFKEVTEGLGCLLGGFCLAMWFLVLKPGGLVAETTGRAIMIGVFCVVGWSLSFSQYTRNYGLIGCTAFGGAMITILGVDCFSRAGLKEFWLYIWDLNKDTFPINTRTYPITRGIRVEIAGTIVLFLFGVMSQIKIWKIVRERKAKHEAAREAEAERREQRDSAIGKKVEAKNERSLAQWEAVYGDKSKTHVHTDSGVWTSLDGDAKKSTSVNEREPDSIEMNDMGGMVAKRSSKEPRNTVMIHTVEEDEEQKQLQQLRELQLDLDPEERQWWEDFKSVKSQSKPATVRDIDDSSLNEMLPPDRPPVPGGPAVVPLPFAPAEEENTAGNKSEASAAAASASKAQAEDKPVKERRGVALNKLTLEKLDQGAPLRRIDDDRRSSVAATDNDEPDLDDRSTHRKSLAPTITLGNERLSPFSDAFREDVPRSPHTPGTPIENPVDDEDDEILVRSPPPQVIEPEEERAKRRNNPKQKRRSSIGSQNRATGSIGSGNDDEEADDAASVHSLKGHLPDSISKVAMAYRTNEWAKHIADADQPEYEPAEEVEVDGEGVQVEVGRPVETPRPLDPAAMAETSPPPELKISSNPSFRQSKAAPPPEFTRKSSTPTPVYAFQRSSSQQSLQRQGSGTSLSQRKPDIRQSSAPITQQTLMESPIDENEEFVTPFASTSNLLDERNTRLSRRTTTTSFNALANPSLNLTSPTPEPGAPRSDAPSVLDQSTTTSDPTVPGGEENLTLAERKALMQQGTITPAPPTSTTNTNTPRRPTRQSSTPTPQPSLGRVSSTHNPALIYDSHQPRRSNTVDTQKQSAMFSQWRSSLVADTATKPPLIAEEQARQAMLSQRERAGARRQKETRQRETRESMRDVAMRSGVLVDRHQEALRKMQAKANESAH